MSKGQQKKLLQMLYQEAVFAAQNYPDFGDIDDSIEVAIACIEVGIEKN
ncbi:hypothetical protein [Clostridium aciditolerans]|nr:hypothetical protein [Clostridium aciditolerans]